MADLFSPPASIPATGDFSITENFAGGGIRGRREIFETTAREPDSNRRAPFGDRVCQPGGFDLSPIPGGTSDGSQKSVLSYGLTGLKVVFIIQLMEPTQTTQQRRTRLGILLQALRAAGADSFLVNVLLLHIHPYPKLRGLLALTLAGNEARTGQFGPHIVSAPLSRDQAIRAALSDHLRPALRMPLISPPAWVPADLSANPLFHPTAAQLRAMSPGGDDPVTGRR
jgi:hypothetical protein